MERPFDEMTRLVESHVQALQAPRVLDAGCGLKERIRWGADAWLVGIDNDQAALDKNDGVHEKILGDIHTHPLPENSFDVVTCWDVLEHLPEPRKAMDNMLGALRPGGLMVFVMPNPTSLKALVTKYTPHAFHVWAYRNVLGLEHAGKPGYAPFPVFLRPDIKPAAVRRFAAESGLTVEMLRVYEGGQMRRLAKQRPVLSGLVNAVSGLLYALSFGRYDGRLTDTCVVLRKAPAQP